MLFPLSKSTTTRVNGGIQKDIQKESEKNHSGTSTSWANWPDKPKPIDSAELWVSDDDVNPRRNSRRLSGSWSSEGNRFEAFFGPELQTKDGMKSTSEVLNGKRAVLVYFSANYCQQQPRREVTPMLAKAYFSHTLQREDVEVVFVSSDPDQASFDAYYGDMPWAALPFANRMKKDLLETEFGPQLLPKLVVLKGDDTTTVTGKGCEDVYNSFDLEAALKYWGV